MDVFTIPWPDAAGMPPPDEADAVPVPPEADVVMPMPPVPLPPSVTPSMTAAPASSGMTPTATDPHTASSHTGATTRRQEATLAQLSGVRDADLDHDFTERARHGKPRLRFSGKHALIAVIAMTAVTCMSLTLLVTQSVNHAAMTAANASEGGDVTFRAIDGDGTADDDHTQGDASETEGGDGTDADDTTGGTTQPQQGTAQDATAPTQPPQDTRLDLNAATAEQLDAISGIGPVTARKIVEYREKNGRFSSVDQLLDIPGIGVKTLEKIRPEVRV